MAVAGRSLPAAGRGGRTRRPAPRTCVVGDSPNRCRCSFRPMALHRFSAALLLATVCPASAAAQRIVYDSTARTWTLTSGPASYRLVRRAQQVAFDWFGPTSRMDAHPDTTQPPGSDLTGIVATQPLELASLRLLSDSVVPASPGVAELRLH